MEIEVQGERLISAKELQRLVPYSRVHILRMEKAGQFPTRIRLGPSRTGRVAWRLREIVKWIEERAAERDTDARKTG